MRAGRTHGQKESILCVTSSAGRVILDYLPRRRITVISQRWHATTPGIPCDVPVNFHIWFMRHYKCTCGNVLFFENSTCLQCGTEVGYDLLGDQMVALTNDAASQ